ncbi:MAG: helix-turn-helix domain-containing protein [Euzebya sp.]
MTKQTRVSGIEDGVALDGDDTRARAGSLLALRALTHVTRLRMWSVLAGGPSSAAGLARRLGLQHAAASYHLRVLRDVGLVVLSDEHTVNGGTELRYRVVTAPAEPVRGESSTTADWIAVVAAMGAVQQERAARVSLDPRWFDDVEVWVASESFDEARHHLEAAFTHLRAAAVDPATPGAVPLSASGLLFTLHPGTSGGGGRHG